MFYYISTYLCIIRCVLTGVKSSIQIQKENLQIQLPSTSQELLEIDSQNCGMSLVYSLICNFLKPKGNAFVGMT